MGVEYKTISLGSGLEGEKRRLAYEKAADKEKENLSDWMRQVLDKAAGFKFVDGTKK